MGNSYTYQTNLLEDPVQGVYRQRFSNWVPKVTYYMGESESEEALDLLCDNYARQILAHLSKQPMVAEEIGEKCRGSRSTVYERLDQLRSMGLVSENLQIDPEGHHRTQYETLLNSVYVTFHDGVYDVQLEIEEDPADRLAGMWGGMRRE